MEVFPMKKWLPNNHIDRETREEIIKEQEALCYIVSTSKYLNYRKHITQKELGEMLGVSQSTIARRKKDATYKVRIKQLESENRELKRCMGLDDNDDAYNVINMPEDCFRQLPDNSRKNIDFKINSEK